MNKLFVMAAAAALLMFSAPAMAQDFSFDADLEGEGKLTWEIDFTETTDWTEKHGSEFAFNGGAGSEGEANAYGEYTGVGGIFGQYSWGDGDAYSNTLGGNYAEAQFHAASGSINGGYAAEDNFNGDPSKIKYDGMVLNGGAGSATTGLYSGTEFAYNQTGLVKYNVDADLDFSYNESP